MSERRREKRNERRGPWYLITGVLLGAVMGLAYAWVVQPVQYTNTSPASLRADFKDQYRSLIAAAYTANSDLVRARARLALLQDPDVYRTLAEQAQRTLAGGSSLQEARALGILAVALGQAAGSPAPVQPVSSPQSSPLAAPTDTPTSSPTPDLQTNVPDIVTPTGALTNTLATSPAGTAGPTTTGGANRTPRPSPTVTLSPTPLPTRTPSPTPGAPFALRSQEPVCNPDLSAPLIQIEALDAAEQGVPGIEVIVTWQGGENHFFTGLKPELGLGYADFEMAEGVAYTVRLAEGGQPVTNLIATECPASGGARLLGGWMLVFIQP